MRTSKLPSTLDIGSHINARPELLPEAEARHERTLEAVSSMPRLCENSIFRKGALIESIAYLIKNARIWGFHTVCALVRPRPGRQLQHPLPGPPPWTTSLARRHGPNVAMQLGSLHLDHRSGLNGREDCAYLRH
jgi:hypothetical protein